MSLLEKFQWERGDGATLKPDDVLYRFDGPIIFTATIGISKMLLCKIDEYDDLDVFLSAHTNQETVKALAANELSVRGALGNSHCYLILADAEGGLQHFCGTQIPKIPSEYLPQFGVGLRPTSEWVADNVEQLGSFFAVRFSGDALGVQYLPFHEFKKLVDNFYHASRKIFAPEIIQGLKSSLFDFQIKQPTFGSLILTLDQPLLRTHRLKRRADLKEVNLEMLRAKFFDERDAFLADANEVVGYANDRDLSDEEIAKFFRLIENLSELLPDVENSDYLVEFSSATSDKVNHIAIHSEAASRLKDARKRSLKTDVPFSGAIIIINDSSRTFVIRAETMRQITCHIDQQIYSQLKKDERFRNGARVRVKGRFNPRPKRDELHLSEPPSFL